MEKSERGVNQQESLDLQWLAGFIDGEGSFSITRHHQNGKTYYQADISIVNTNPLDIDKAARIISRITGFNIETKEPHRHKRNARYTIWRIRIIGFKRTKKFLVAIIPYLNGKKEQAEHLLRFVNSSFEDDREKMKEELATLRNPQRLYARQMAILKIAA